MNNRTLFAWIVGCLLFTLMFAGMTRRAPVTHAAVMGDHVMSTVSELGPGAYFTETVLTLHISNEAPGHLIDFLTAQGHGNQTLFEVLGYLKSQSGGIISDAFYNQVAGAPVGSEVFAVHLSSYVGLNGAVEISADGTVHPRSLLGKNHVGLPGFATALSQDKQFTFTYAQDTEHYIYTGSSTYELGSNFYTYNYYTFAIAWKQGQRYYLPLIMR